MNKVDTAAEAPDLTALARKIDDAHHDCEQSMQAGLRHAVEAGTLLMQAKAALRHGGWLGWLQRDTRGTPRLPQASTRGAPSPRPPVAPA